ncbi:MAG: GGDEF domain-containing protein [Gammaproteobacteria bacterium]|nr:GGDEF domain-containing protein [Gammaproteobacteria bacterium]MBV9620101.1 GGDEF domain-containing protein [Gammaproteobacteria bacterium]
MPDAALPASRFAEACAARARGTELSQQLRSAAIDGDEARIAKLLGELLRCKGLSRGQRIALQHKALVNLVHSLRCAALNDDVTGLLNRRGFVQMGTRLLDLAARDSQPAHLISFQVENLTDGGIGYDSPSAEMLVRHIGNLLRDLFPSYGVYEVLGRLGRHEFVALTMRPEHASAGMVLSRVRGWRCEGCSLQIGVGIAHFEPDSPVGIDQLLAQARMPLESGAVSRPMRYEPVATPA